MRDQANGWRAWDDFGEVMEAAFSVWPPAYPERAWGSRTWWLITKDMTETDGYIDGFALAIRFLALSGIYLDFCKLAWDVERLSFCDDWATQLGLDRYTIEERAYWEWLDGGSLEDWHEWYGATTAGKVTIIVNREREVVWQVLLEHHGSAKRTLADLWRSAPLEQQGIVAPGAPSSWIPTSPVTDAEFDELILPAQQQTFHWIIRGCQPILPVTNARER